ncbi:sensor histidine kinase [Microbacterium hominis]|uniref:histidine kinase n=1 Tax=Microbacterium hominis TaxID=162426 RepID=A0A7D4PTG0_9MICO|nr:HAMP domain-containing sensor histidine kinase [Microbacterium hominis]QKJ18833.1 HAMP domain-containing protein [Microbacterium hominis]
MARTSDAVTRWWRGISLRAKVTGVCVAVLAAGLFGAGIGTTTFLRTALVGNVDTNLRQLAQTDVTSPLLDLETVDGVLETEPTENAAQTDFFVAVYEPTEGELVGTAGGRGAPAPDFPESFPLDRAIASTLAPFNLTSVDGEAEYRATVTVEEVRSTGVLYTQLVAVPLASVNRTIATYLGIYSVIAVITIVAGALLTRLLVTLAFRSLRQVETTATAIAEGDFSIRMTDIAPGTEVGRLKAAINTMLGEVDVAIGQRDATVQQMRRFIGDASHELRTPLVTVRGYAELYRMGAISTEDDVTQSMDRIEKEAIRMGVLVEDLLNLARLDERRDVVIAPVDLRPIARDAALDVRAAAPRRPVTVIDTTAQEPPATTGEVSPAPVSPSGRRRPAPNTSAISRAGATLSLLRRRPRTGSIQTARPSGDAPAGGPPRPSNPVPAPAAPIAPIVLGDENRVRQVVTNLLGNAQRFTAEDSPIELRVGVDPEAALGWIEIVDHGEGVPDQIKEKIFQRFWRADTSRTRETGGTGLGLSIVSAIVEALHGSVGVVDTPGGGATFRVGFPLQKEREAADQRFIQTQPIRRPTADDA